MDELTLHSVAALLRERRCVRDARFDRVYPPLAQSVSRRFWTPVRVALTGAGWLREARSQRLLDVGSGVGKFCIVTQLAAGCATHGVEQRESLVEAARAAARK